MTRTKYENICKRIKSPPQICYASGPSWTRATIVLARFARSVSYTPQREYVSDDDWQCEYASDSIEREVDQLYLISSRYTLIRLTTNNARASSPAVCSAWRKAIKNKNQIILQWKFFFTKSGSDYYELWNINDLSSPATRVAIVRSRDANQRRTNEVVAGRSTIQHIVDWTPLLSSYNNNRYCPKQYIEYWERRD